MNRIILIGNGFDKAHGLPTGYDDFFNWLEKKIIEEKDQNEQSIDKTGFNNSIIGQIIDAKRAMNPVLDDEDYNEYCNKDKWIAINKETNRLVCRRDSGSIYFESLFDMRENETETGRWSDLERNYFEVLREYKHNKEAILIINEEFEHLKQLLEDYLITEVEDKVKDGTYSFDDEHPIFEMLIKGRFKYEKNYFVSFNYTSEILDKYVDGFFFKTPKGKKISVLLPIHIHGALKDDNNPIIFGYGDENSSDYEELEKIQNNELLKNFKTFQYLRTNKYSQVLGLLDESEENYIQIIGHSCGMCDKALLRAIFQHPNTKDIEAVYYQKEAGDYSQYFENLYNISRIFDDNTLMRERLVPLEKTIKIPPKK